MEFISLADSIHRPERLWQGVSQKKREIFPVFWAFFRADLPESAAVSRLFSGGRRSFQNNNAGKSEFSAFRADEEAERRGKKLAIRRFKR